jgi:lipoprotein-releasing system permease protein
MRLPFFIAKRYFFARKGTFIRFITLISILGVAIGVFALIIALSISNGFTDTMKRKLNEFYADINILGLSAEIDKESAENIIDSLKTNPDVKGVSPIVLGIGILTTNDHPKIARIARVLGIDENSYKSVVDLKKYVRGNGELINYDDGSKGAIIGVDLANSLGLDIGDTIDFIVPKTTMSPFGSIPKIITLKITGILKSDYYLYDTEFVYLDLNLSKKIFTDGGVHSIEVRLKDPSRLASVKENLKNQLGQKFRVVDLIETNKEFFKALKMERLLLFIAIGLIVIVASLNIVSTLILMVMEKVRDIGLLRSIGASSKDIRNIFLFEGLIIGVIGTLIGDILGALCTHFLNKYKVIPLSLDVYPIPYVPFESGIWQILIVTAFSIIVSFLATLYPSKKASNLIPLDALRYE